MSAPMRCSWRGRKNFHVIATVRNGDADYVRGLGAHEVINTETDNLANFARRADAVIDTVGGPLQDQLLTFVKSGGIMVSSVSRPNVQLAQKRRVRADYFIVDVNTAQLARLAEMHDKNELVVPVGSVLPLSEARAAHEMLAGTRAHKRGKIVLSVPRITRAPADQKNAWIPVCARPRISAWMSWVPS